MKELRTEIEIQAAPDKLWQVLTSLDKYSEWNPFIRQAIGKAKVGEKVDITRITLEILCRPAYSIQRRT